MSLNKYVTIVCDECCNGIDHVSTGSYKEAVEQTFRGFTFDGKRGYGHLHPSLFHSEDEWREYVASTGSNEDDKIKDKNLAKLLLSLMNVKEKADYFSSRCCLFNHLVDCPECMNAFEIINDVLADHEAVKVSIKIKSQEDKS